MANFSDLVGMARRLVSRPDAYSRITRTPIYFQDKPVPSSPDTVGAYYPGEGNIVTTPESVKDVVPHESAHALFRQGHMERLGQNLAGQVPVQHRIQVKSSGYDSSPETMANEGLGYSIGDPDATGYVKSVSDRMQPELSKKLLRLNQNALQRNKTVLK